MIDAGFAALLTVLGLTGFRYSFGRYEYLVVGVAAALLGAIVALLIVRLRLPSLFAVAVGAVVFLVAGSIVAIRDEAFLGFLPTPAGVTGLVDGMISGWRRLLTTLPPSGSLGNLLAVPFLCGYVPALLTTVLARKTRLLGVLTLLPLIVLALSVLFGDRRPFSLVLQGAIFGGAALVWLALRRGRERRVFMQTSGHKRIVSGAFMVGLVGLVGIACGPRLPFGDANDRYVLSRENPPFDPRDYPSPLNGYGRYLNGDLREKVLFTATGVPTLEGENFGRVRLATLDDYNGVVWDVNPLGGSQSYQFIRVGERVPIDIDGDEVEVEFEIGDLKGVWVPDFGLFTGISWGTPGERGERQRDLFRLSTYTNTAAVPIANGLAPGDSYRVRAVEEVRPSDNDLRSYRIDASLRTKIDAPVPDVLRSSAGEIVKNKTTALDQAVALEEWFHDNGYYTTGNDAVGESELIPGHSAARLAAFLEGGTPVGSSEQFATSMALMARAVGLPARVVMGFRVAGEGAVEVKGDDVDAWVEIPFMDATGETTWVSFDPTPRDKTNKPPDVVTKSPKPKFDSQDVPPPPLPPPPPEVIELETGQTKKPNAPKKPAEKDPETDGSGGVPVVALAAAGGSPVLLFALFALTVLLLKWRRRRTRRRADAPSSSVAGGWAEFVDAALDMGLPIPPRSTRREAALMIGAAPGVALARGADAAVFGPSVPSPNEVNAYWTQVQQGRRELRSTVSLWRRLKASVSLTSLRNRG